MKFSLYLGKYKGIKVFIHWTFSILLLWIIIANAKSGVAWLDTVWSLIFILCLFLCVILHEFGHALTAKRYGIDTKDIILLPIGVWPGWKDYQMTQNRNYGWLWQALW